MTIYLGAPGSLQAIAYMGRGIDASLDLGTVQHQTLSGARTVDRVGTPKRSYSMDRKYLTADEIGQLEGMAMGLYGAEPYALIDPWRRNLLTPNQSSAGDFTHDLTGVTSSVGTRTIVGPSVNAEVGVYYVQYLSPSSGAAGTAGVRFGDSSSAAAVTTVGNNPVVVPGLAYTFQVDVFHSSGTAASWRATLAFYDSSGVIIGSATNGTGSVVTAAWTQRSVTATAPANAAYAVPSLTNNATLAATNTIRLDQAQLAQSSSVSAWVPGTGVPRVAITSLGDKYPSVDSHDGSVTLVEVG